LEGSRNERKELYGFAHDEAERWLAWKKPLAWDA
jgi:hypothetical protein